MQSLLDVKHEENVSSNNQKVVSRKDRRGVYQRLGRQRWYISYVNESGRRIQRKTKALTKAAALKLRNELLARAEKLEILGVAEPAPESFESVAQKFLESREDRVTQ